MAKLFLIDAYSLIYRAHFAFIRAPRINSKGENTSAVFGFTNTLLDIIEREKPTHISVVFDPPGLTFRHTDFEAYKANRQETPEDIKLAVPIIKELSEALGIHWISVDNYEADDVIGTLAKKAEKEGYQVFMMTPDKDYGQLVSKNIFQYKPGYQGKPFEILGEKEICEKWGIENVDQVRDVLGLMGDAVDNIPGIPGIGEKTAVKLINEYGTVENLIQNGHLIKGKLGESIVANADKGILSKRLATIILDVPCEFIESEFFITAQDKEKIKSIFDRLEFRGLSKRVLGDEVQSGIQGKSPQLKQDLFSGVLFGNTSETVTQGNVEESNDETNSENKLQEISIIETIETFPHVYIHIDSEEGRINLSNQLKDILSFAFDTETTSLDIKEAMMVGFSICFKSGEAYYVSCKPSIESGKEALLHFKKYLESEKIEKIGSNLKYDISVLHKYDINFQGKLFDTVLAHYLIEPDQRHGMDILAEKYLNYRPISISELIGKKGKNQLTMDMLPPEKISDYACEDADVVFRLKPILEPLLQENGAEKLLNEMEAPLSFVLSDMELEGIKIDKEALNEYSKELSVDIAKLEQDIQEYAGTKFNLNSPAQLGEILFDKLKLDPKAKRTAKSKQYATGEEVLQSLLGRHEIIQSILDYRGLQKLRSTYVDALPLLISKITSRLHTTFNQTVAATGRLSSTDPNLQNIPIRTEKGREIRRSFIARDENHILLSADYSQIELRLIAEISKEENMIEAFKNGIDIHSATAARVFSVPLEEVTSDMRRKAKMVNFGIIYGISAFGLSQRLGVSRSEAGELIKNYNTTYPGIKRYMDEQIQYAKEHGYVETIKGRRRYLRDINSVNFAQRGFAERNAINAPIQGSAADMIKIAMINIHHQIIKEGLKSRMLLQVHDELIFDVPLDEKERMKDLVKSLMESAIGGLTVPIEAEVGFGKNWLEAH